MKWIPPPCPPCAVGYTGAGMTHFLHHHSFIAGGSLPPVWGIYSFIHSFSPQRLTKFLPSGHPYTAENNFLHSWGLEVPDPVKHSYGYWKVHLGLCVIELGLLCCSASLTDWPWASQVNVQMSVSSSIKYRHCLPISASPADFSAWMWDLWIQIQGLRHLWHVLLG